MMIVLTRPFSSDDRAACLTLFDSNVPAFFAASERTEFSTFLNEVDAGEQQYLVLIRDGAVVACGGLSINSGKRQASLAWGMVARELHGLGLGKRLTMERLALADGLPNIAELVLSTSQHTQGFYAGLGFTVLKVATDGLAPGLDRWDMVLPLIRPR